MSKLSVSQFAAELNLSVEVLLKHLKSAGLEKTSAEEQISTEDKDRLLSYLRRSSGADSSQCVTLTRKETIKIKKADATGKARTISVEVKKKKRVFIKPGSTEQEAPQDISDLLDRSEIEQRKQEEERQAELRARQEAELKAKHGGKETDDLAVDLSEVSSVSVEGETSSSDHSEELVLSVQINLPEAILEEEPSSTQASMDEILSDTVTPASTVAPTKPSVDLDKKQAEKPSDRKGSKKSSSKSFGGAKEWDSNRRGASKSGGRDSRASSWGSASKSSRNSSRRRVEDTGPGHFHVPLEPIVRDISVPETISVSDLAKKMSVKAAEVIKTLMKMGTMVTINQVIDQETAMIVVDEMGHRAVAVRLDTPDIFLEQMASTQKNTHFIQRPPVVTVMGHVDHGKTSLLDYIRRTKVVSQEAGGITQHIGAYHVKTPKGAITFLDTPGHEAFTAMRARGAKATDIVILVVAADDGIKPQTVEAINHAKAAAVPIVVAVNKIDKSGADQEKIKNAFLAYGIVSEELGGDAIFVPVSAKHGTNIDLLLDAILLQAEMLDLNTPLDSCAKGVVIEARLDKGRGPLVTVLVQSGVLHQGDMLLAGRAYGHVRAMVNEYGEQLSSAGPSIPVEIQGLSSVPFAGVEALVLEDDRKTREIALFRQGKFRETKLATQAAQKMDNAFDQMAEDSKKSLALLVKCDVQGSQEALISSLQKLSNEEISISIVHAAVGGITESDIHLAIASKAIVIGFNTRPSTAVKKIADSNNVSLTYFNVIYDVVDHIRAIVSGLMTPDKKEKIIGEVEVRRVFTIPKVGIVAGCYVKEGIIRRASLIRVLREGVVVHEGEVGTLKRFKEDVKEVRASFECGITFKNLNDVQLNDLLEVYEIEEVARKL